MPNLGYHPLCGVKTRRKMLEVTAATAAKAIGVNPNSFGRLERGERVLSLPKALTLSRLLQCTVEQLGIEPSIDEQAAAYRAKLERDNYNPNNLTPEQVEAAFAEAQLDQPNSSTPYEKIAAGLNDAITHAREQVSPGSGTLSSVVAQPAPRAGTSPSASELDDEVKRMMTEWAALGDDEADQ